MRIWVSGIVTSLTLYGRSIICVACPELKLRSLIFTHELLQMKTTARYYPQFFRANRPYAKSMEADFTEARQDGRINPKISFDIVGKNILRAYTQLGLHATADDFPLQDFSRESSTALTQAQWRFDGSVIFDFEPALCEAFLRSDVDDIHLSDLNFPYRGFYLHFGQQPELPLYGGELFAEGAYIIYSPTQSMRVILAARYEKASLGWEARTKETYQLKIGVEHFNVDLGTAIDLALAEDLEDLRAALHSKAGRLISTQMDLEADIASYSEAHMQNQETFRKALRLVVNGLSYLTAYPADVDNTWQPGTPEKLRHKADEAANVKERERAKSKLISQGFSPVHRVGQAFQAEVEAEGAQRKAHWRRGHWRHQAHGPGFSQRKLIWVRPTRISGSEGGEASSLFKVVEE